MRPPEPARGRGVLRHPVSAELANLTHRDDPVDAGAVPAVAEVLTLDGQRDGASAGRRAVDGQKQANASVAG